LLLKQNLNEKNEEGPPRPAKLWKIQPSLLC